jgi:hypothetical protein
MGSNEEVNHPPCYNREPFTDPNAGWHDTGSHAFRPVYRYRWPWFTDRCATHDGVGIGQPTAEYPSGVPYPMAHGWNCEGCRWKP